MKVHVKVGDFEFVEQEVSTAEEARETYDSVHQWFSEGDGISGTELNNILDTMLRGETVKGGTEIWARMNIQQKYVTNELKKACKRINKTTNKEE